MVRTDLTAADGTELPPLEVALPVERADLLDATATPTVAVLAVVATLRGEDLVVEAPVDRAALDGAHRLTATLASWWETPTPAIDVDGTFDARRTGDGVGLFFTRGVDSWSTLLDLLDEPPGDRVTHLYSVHQAHEDRRPIEAEVVEGHRRVASELGLDLVVVSTTIRALVDPFKPWIQVAGPGLISAGLTAAAGMGRLVMAGSHAEDVVSRTGTDAGVIRATTTGAVEVALGNPVRDRLERVAHLLTDPLARATLQVCWEGSTSGNCGRCRKCQLTMAALALAGDRDPGAGFGHGPDPALVRAGGIKPDGVPMVRPLAERLPPEHEELRRAYADVVATAVGDGLPVRWGDDSVPGLAGPGAPQRVAAALRATTGTAEHPPAPPLGWRAGAVPLRPALADHERLRALAADGPRRAGAWAVVETHVRGGDRDGDQAGLALRCAEAFGPGPTYLSGILWAADQPPVLPPRAVAALLGTVRSRLWWRPAGDLDPLRVVETVENGCLPLQVMPDGPARHLQALVPEPLAALVVPDSELADLDLSPEGVAARLGPAVDHLLAGNAEHDLLMGAHGG